MPGLTQHGQGWMTIRLKGAHSLLPESSDVSQSTMWSMGRGSSLEVLVLIDLGLTCSVRHSQFVFSFQWKHSSGHLCLTTANARRKEGISGRYRIRMRKVVVVILFYFSQCSLSSGFYRGPPPFSKFCLSFCKQILCEVGCRRLPRIYPQRFWRIGPQ